MTSRSLTVLFLCLSWGAAAHQWFFRGVAYDAVVYGLVVPAAFLALSVLRRLTGRGDERWLRSVQWLALLILSGNIPGTLGLHDAGIQYDRYLHFGVAFLSLPLGVLITLSFGVKRPLVPVLVFCFAGLFIFELNQWFWDQAVGTRLFYDVAQHINRDFWEDIVFGALGLAAAYVPVRRRMRMFSTMARALSA